MSKNNKSRNYENKVSATVDTIYSNLHEVPITEGFAKFKKNSAYVRSALVLLNLGAIKNLATKNKPKYVWNEEIEKSPELVHKVTEILQDKNRTRNMKYKKENHSDAVDTKPIDIFQPIITGAEKPLNEFSDQQLWDELKARQYHIQDNTLVKTVTYTLQ